MTDNLRCGETVLDARGGAWPCAGSTAEETVREAQRRYFHDAQFHAQVEQAVAVVEIGAGRPLEGRVRGQAAIAASVALVMHGKASP